MLPVLVNPAPAVIPAAPENCTQVTAVVPSVPPAFTVHNHPVSPLVPPSSTHTYAEISSAHVSASVARVQAPEATI